MAKGPDATGGPGVEQLVRGVGHEDGLGCGPRGVGGSERRQPEAAPRAEQGDPGGQGLGRLGVEEEHERGGERVEGARRHGVRRGLAVRTTSREARRRLGLAAEQVDHGGGEVDRGDVAGGTDGVDQREGRCPLSCSDIEGPSAGSGCGQLDEAGADRAEPGHAAPVVAGSELVEERGDGGPTLGCVHGPIVLRRRGSRHWPRTAWGRRASGHPRWVLPAVQAARGRQNQRRDLGQERRHLAADGSSAARRPAHRHTAPARRAPRAASAASASCCSPRRARDPGTPPRTWPGRGRATRRPSPASTSSRVSTSAMAHASRSSSWSRHTSSVGATRRRPRASSRAAGSPTPAAPQAP